MCVHVCIRADVHVLSKYKGCVRCGTIKKSGKHSCCARGGAWFKECGDAGDTKFDHTWAEGVQACKGYPRSVSVKSPVQERMGHTGVVVFALQASRSRNTTAYQTNINGRGSTNSSNDDIRSSKNRDAVASIALVCVVFVIFNLQTN